MNSDRRSFFKTLGTAAAAAAVTVPGITQTAAAATLPVDGRAFNVKRNILEIEGQTVGDLTGVNGGYPVGVVVEEGMDAGGVVRKRLAGSSFKDLVLSGGAGMGKPFFDLIANFLALDSQSFNGNISDSDAKFREGGRLDFQDAVVKSVRFPALDGSSKTAGTFEVTCQVGSSTRSRGDLQKAALVPKPKAFLVSNFRVSIDGLSDTMALTSRVESFLVQQEFFPPAGSARAFVDAGPLQIPDLVMTVGEQRSEALYEWFENMVVKGLPDERNGKIELLSTDLKTVLFTLELRNLGIWWLATEDGDESVLRRVTAKMYCEEMRFK